MFHVLCRELGDQGCTVQSLVGDESEQLPSNLTSPVMWVCKGGLWGTEQGHHPRLEKERTPGLSFKGAGAGTGGPCRGKSVRKDLEGVGVKNSLNCWSIRCLPTLCLCCP